MMDVTARISHDSSSDNTHESGETFNKTHIHKHKQSLHDFIVTWAVSVEEASSLPPLTVIPPAQFYGDYPGYNLRPKNHILQISLPIPRNISDNIRSQLSRTINARSSVSLLRNLPHPKKLPLVSNKVFIRRETHKHLHRL